MTEDYLQIMVESLQKKNDVLDKITELEKRQLTLALKQPPDLEAYDALMDVKGNLIDELGRLDDGFTHTYELVKEKVKKNPHQYQEQVHAMQELIRAAIEKGVSIEAQEQRNKQAMQNMLRTKRVEIKQVKVSNSAASQYYKAMSRINNIDPQLMDRKN